MKATLYLLFIISVVSTTLGQSKAFPQQLSFAGCIKPNNYSQATLNSDVTSYYNYWKGLYLKASANTANAYYVQGENTGGGASDKGTSEGHGYGMIITALMAGYDANAKVYYDGLYKFYNNHRSSIDNNLMGWLIDASETTSGNYDSATDGDLDIAYSLLLAHYQWGSAGTINYLAEATRMINALKNSNINASNRTNLGDWDNNNYNTRPSDWMFDHFKAFECATGDNTWATVHSSLTTVMNTMQTNYSPSTGLLPDFVVNNAPQPAAANFLEGPEDGKYYYNACRTPMRIVMDYAHYGTASSKTAVNKMITWAKGATITNGIPANFRAGYNLNGTNIAGNNYPAAVFIAPIVAAATCDAAHQAYLNAGWDAIKNMKEDYFNDTYNLMTMLYISGNWWPPYNCGVTLNLLENDWNEDKPGSYASLFELISDGNQLQIRSGESEAARVVFLNTSGVSLFDQTLNGHQQIAIPLQNIIPGVYFIQLTTRERNWTKRVIVSGN